jgi:hypothetical protein
VVLGQVVGVEARVLVALDQRKALLELPAEREPALVDVIEDPELHLLPPSRALGRRADYRGLTRRFLLDRLVVARRSRREKLHFLLEGAPKVAVQVRRAGPPTQAAAGAGSSAT